MLLATASAAVNPAPSSKRFFLFGVVGLAALSSLLVSAGLWLRGPGPHAETVLGWGVAWLTALVLIALSVPALSRIYKASGATGRVSLRAILALPVGLLLGPSAAILSAALWSLLDHAP